MNLWPNIETTFDENPEYKHIPLRYAYDVALTLTAKQCDIPIFSLDARIPAYREKFSKGSQFLKKYGPDIMEAMTMLEYEKRNQNPSTQEVFQAWKCADVRFIERIRGSFLKGRREREAQWVKTLISHVKNTKKSIAVVVGVSHLVGKDGLAQTFANAGMKVQFMQLR